MIILGTDNTACGLMQGLEILRMGGSAIDAVETALRAVEANADDGSVGLGGLPNLLGEVELDASIMEGAQLRSGAVGALKHYLHPISVARQVMEMLPHVLLVGQGAELFASEINAEKGELLTTKSIEKYDERMRATALKTEPDGDVRRPLHESLWLNLHYRPSGTANVIAQDDNGHICCGVTTSGWAFKYPGRLGDSPIIGAGNYADDRYGSAACTGIGEATIRLCSAHAVVAAMAAGRSLEDSMRSAISDLKHLQNEVPVTVNILALSYQGEHRFMSTTPENRYYLWAAGSDSEPHREPAEGVS